VQRGALGIQGRELNSAVSDNLGVEITQGLYVENVIKDSGAEKAGIKKGDVIIKIDERVINGFADMNGAIVTKRPNDIVKVSVDRKGKIISLPVKLSKNEINSYTYEGLEMKDIDDADKKRFNIDFGVKVTEITDEGLMPYYDELKNGIILSIGNVKARDIETVTKILNNRRPNQRLRVEMVTQNGQLVQFLI
jgi:membrane-associated protease RseP (regulator of RpoE activity)